MCFYEAIYSNLSNERKATENKQFGDFLLKSLEVCSCSMKPPTRKLPSEVTDPVP